MQSKRKTKKSKKNKGSFLSYIVAGILFFSFLFLIIIPFLKSDFLPISKLIINAACEMFVPFSVLITTVATFADLLIDHRKGQAQTLAAVAKKVLCVVIAFTISLSMPFAGKAVIQHYEENYVGVIGDDENVDPVLNSNDIEDSGFVFLISFDDVLLEGYTIKELTENCESLELQIYKELVNTQNINLGNSHNNFSKYEQCVLRAMSYEDVYLVMCQEYYFQLEDREERYRFLDKCIEFRQEADMYYKDEENQRLIGYRYLEYASECCFDEDFEKELMQYKKSIKWFLMSFNTAFCRYGHTDISNLSTIDLIIETYDEICRVAEFDEDTYQRANILRGVYRNIKEVYFSDSYNVM